MEVKKEVKLEEKKSNLALESRKKIVLKWSYRSYKLWWGENFVKHMFRNAHGKRSGA